MVCWGRCSEPGALALTAGFLMTEGFDWIPSKTWFQWRFAPDAEHVVKVRLVDPLRAPPCGAVV